MAGRKKQYVTEEQLKERKERVNDYRRARRNAGFSREELKNPCRKYIINDKDGFVITIETMNRLTLDTIDICFIVNFSATNGVAWGYIKSDIAGYIKKWLDDQNIYDPKNKIFIFEHPTDYAYTGEYRSFSFQLYLKRIVPPQSNWKKTYTEVIPFVYDLKEQIKNTSRNEGIEIIRRLPYNKKMREKILLNEACILTNNASQP